MSEIICSDLLSGVLILAYYALNCAVCYMPNLFQLMSIFEKFKNYLLGSFDTLELFITKEHIKTGLAIS